MKKKILYIILAISILGNVIQGIQPKNGKTRLLNNKKVPVETENRNKGKDTESTYIDDIFCNNPIDSYFVKKINTEDSEIQIELDKDAYMQIWKEQYRKILDIIRQKCIYDEDREIYEKYNSFIKEIYNNTETAVVSVMLNNFKYSPQDPAKYSFGMATDDELNMYKGIIYRNACVILILYLNNEYSYPTVKEMESYLNKYKSK